MDSFEELKALCDSKLKLLAMNSKEYQRLRDEIKSIVDALPPISDCQSINDLSNSISQIQAAKDRVVNIVHEAQNNNSVRKAIADVIETSAISISTESSADRRKGYAAMKTAEYAISGAEADGFMRYCLGMMKNLDSRHDSISRRITCIQMTIKIGDGGREGIISESVAPRDTSDLFDHESGSGKNKDNGEIDWN